MKAFHIFERRVHGGEAISNHVPFVRGERFDQVVWSRSKTSTSTLSCFSPCAKHKPPVPAPMIRTRSPLPRIVQFPSIMIVADNRRCVVGRDYVLPVPSQQRGVMRQRSIGGPRRNRVRAVPFPWKGIRSARRCYRCRAAPSSPPTLRRRPPRRRAAPVPQRCWLPFRAHKDARSEGQLPRLAERTSSTVPALRRPPR